MNEFGWRARKTTLSLWDMHLIDREAHIYILECCGLLKIGYSAHPKYRLRDLIRETPVTPSPMRLGRAVPFNRAASRHVERWVHRKLERYALEGEWFDCGITKATNTILSAREYERYCIRCAELCCRVEPEAPIGWQRFL